jgi:gamma-glutamylcyclotransferase
MGAERLMQTLYFAYGSNLSSRRMRARVEKARAVGRGLLPGHRLTTDKRGADGSGKANLCPDPLGSVWGVLYRIPGSAWRTLDACEPGYLRRQVVIVGARRQRLRAETYASELLTDDPVLTQSYKSFLVDGAREHGLPEDWIAALQALPAR